MEVDILLFDTVDLPYVEVDEVPASILVIFLVFCMVVVSENSDVIELVFSFDMFDCKYVKVVVNFFVPLFVFDGDDSTNVDVEKLIEVNFVTSLVAFWSVDWKFDDISILVEIWIVVSLAVFNSVDTLIFFKVDILPKVEVEVILMGVSYKIVVVTVVDKLDIVRFAMALNLSDVKTDVLSIKLKVDAFPSVDKIVAFSDEIETVEAVVV